MPITPENSCAGKRWHASKSEANRVLKRLVKSGATDYRTGNRMVKEDFEPYNCWYCDGAHIGHKSQTSIMNNIERRAGLG